MLRRTATVADRRRATRFDGRGLIANVGGTLVVLQDISIGGAKITRAAAAPTDELQITLYPCEGSRINVNSSVRVAATLVQQDDNAIRVRFDTASFALSKLIVSHAARQLGTTPHTVK